MKIEPESKSADRLLEVSDLTVKFALRKGVLPAVSGVSFNLNCGERLGLVGESGAGKSVTGFALLNLISKPGFIDAGRVVLEGRELTSLPEDAMRKIRGNRVSMIFQDPMMTLNPVLTVGTQMIETLQAHRSISRAEAEAIALDKLRKVYIPSPEKRLAQYPHEFSGGMRQRIVIAIALLTDPALIVADEPTTALDVTIQAEIMDLLLELCSTQNMGLLLITHDLAVVSQVTQKIAVMYAGRIIEMGLTTDIIGNPLHPYTQGLIHALPQSGEATGRTPEPDSRHHAQPVQHAPGLRLQPALHQENRHLHRGDARADLARKRQLRRLPLRVDRRTDVKVQPENTAHLLEIRRLVKHFDISGGLLEQLRFEGGRLSRQQTLVRAVNDVTLSILPGETLSVVGESGCGKSTLARAVIGLYPPTSGEVYFEGGRIDNLSPGAMMPYRRKMQMVFQDPYASLNPRMTVRCILQEPLVFHNPGMASGEIRDRIAEVMTQVGVRPGWMDNYPHEFSGGQRQRISIARALMVDPAFIVADEPIAALDVSIQAQILNLLMDAQEQRGLTYLFISHDLSVIRHISTRVAVMYLGTLCEVAPTDPLFDQPLHPYTQALLSAIPRLGGEAGEHIRLSGDVPTPIHLPPGCVFHGRCRYADERCRTEIPEMREPESGRFVACHAVQEGRI